MKYIVLWVGIVSMLLVSALAHEKEERKHDAGTFQMSCCYSHMAGTECHVIDTRTGLEVARVK